MSPPAFEATGLSWAMETAAGSRESLTVGVVPYPAWVEWVTLLTDVQPWTVRMEASPVRIAGVTLAAGAVPRVGEGFWEEDRDTATVSGIRSVILRTVNAAVTLAVGKVVRWAPWYLYVFCSNFAAAEGRIDGWVSLRRVDPVDAPIMPARRNGSYRDPRARAWGVSSQIVRGVS